MSSSTFSSLNTHILSNALSQTSFNHKESKVIEPNQTNLLNADVNKSKCTWSVLDDNWNEFYQFESSNKLVLKKCIEDGDSQFRAVGAPLKMSPKKLRKLLGDYILEKLNETDFENILEEYKQKVSNSHYTFTWDPFSIKNKSQFVKHLKKNGFHFQGDQTTLNILTNAVKTDIVIFNQETYTVSELSHIYNNFIIVMMNKQHYQTIGIKSNKKIQTLFEWNNLPHIFENLMDKNTLYKKQIEKYYERCKATTEKFTLTGIYRKLPVFTREEKQILSKVLQDFLPKTKYQRRHMFK